MMFLIGLKRLPSVCLYIYLLPLAFRFGPRYLHASFELSIKEDLGQVFQYLPVFDQSTS